MERGLRENDEAKRKKAQRAGRPSEACEGFERLVGNLHRLKG